MAIDGTLKAGEEEVSILLIQLTQPKAPKLPY